MQQEPSFLFVIRQNKRRKQIVVLGLIMLDLNFSEGTKGFHYSYNTPLIFKKF